MKEIHTEIEINASPERIWKVLTDFPAYPEWNPFVREIDGQLVTGAKLKVVLQPPGGKGMTFRPKVLKVEPNREFRWLGQLLIHGLFDGEHFFHHRSLGPQPCTLHPRRNIPRNPGTLPRQNAG